MRRRPRTAGEARAARKDRLVGKNGLVTNGLVRKARPVGMNGLAREDRVARWSRVTRWARVALESVVRHGRSSLVAEPWTRGAGARNPVVPEAG